MNRTSSEFAVSVIFDGLLRAAINFTDVHEPSRQACCEDNLVEYLMNDVMSQMHNIKWGKVLIIGNLFYKKLIRNNGC